MLEATPGRPSVVVRSRGTGGGRTLLLCGHIDTVAVEGMTEPPFEARIESDRLYGRGAYDMKAGVAAALTACRDAASLGLPAMSSSLRSPTKSTPALVSRRCCAR